MNKNQKRITLLTLAVILIVTATSVLAIILEDGGSPYRYLSLRGDEVQIYGGRGMYAYNTVEYALMMRAYDWCYLIYGVPLLVIGLVLFLKKSMIGSYIMLSVYFFLFYNFYITSMSISFNPFFLLYLIVFVISFIVILLIMKEISFRQITAEILPKLPVKTISIFVLFLAAYFLISWLSIDIKTFITGENHPDLGIYTTATFNVIDLSIYVPLSITSAILLLRKKPLGAILSVMLMLGAFYTLSALSVFTFMNMAYHELGIADVEFMLIIFAVVCFVFSLISVRRLCGLKYMAQTNTGN